MITNCCGKVQIAGDSKVKLRHQMRLWYCGENVSAGNMMPCKNFPLVVVKCSHFRHRAMTAVLILLGAAGLAHADTVVSSLSNTLQSVSFSSGTWAASSFQMGPQQFILTNVTLS